MPWFINQRENQYCVFKEGQSEPLKCYDAEADASAYLQALYADEGKAVALKDGVIGGYGVAFTGPDRKDLAGEYFTAETNLWLDQYPIIPLLYNHAQDVKISARVVGAARPVRKDEIGVWYEAQLKERDEYEAAILELVKAGALGFSTGSVPHLVQCAADGKLESWPVVELSLTPTPAAGPYLTTVNAVRSHYKSITGGKATMNLLETIKKLVPGLSDEQYAQLEAVLALAGMGSGEVEAAVSEDIKAVAPAITEAQLKSLIDAVRPEPAPAITEAQIKAIVQKVIAPYLKPGNGNTPPAQNAPKSADEIKAEARKSFNLYLHTGRDTRDRAVKALEEGTAGEGGYTVPELFYAEMVVGLKDASIWRAAGARVIQMTSDTMEVPTMTNSTAAVVTDEEGNYSEVDPSFGHVTFTPFKYTKLVKVTEELAADSAFDIWGDMLMPDYNQAFAAAENAGFTTGDGTTGPGGAVTGATVGVTAASASAITADEVIDLYHALGYLYRQNGVFMANDATLKYIRKLKDSTGQYLWQPGMQAGQPDRLMGRPVITNNSMATITNSAKVLLFCDPRYYWIAQRSGLTIDRNPYLYMYNGYIGFFGRMRIDGNVMLAEAFQVLQMHA